MATINSSTVLGFLTPGAGPPAPVYGSALEDAFHDTLQGVLGWTDGSLVRPRWQPQPPNQPSFPTDWASFGITTSTRDWNPYQYWDNTALAYMFERDEELELLVSFYGNDASAIQAQFADGILVAQNLDALNAQAIKLRTMSDAYQVPALLKEVWVRKVDQRFFFRRRVRRVYPVQTLVGADVYINNEHFITHVVV